MKLSKILFTIFILLGILFQGCTNLDEKVYDKLPVEEFGYTESQLNALIAPIYRTLKNIFPSEFFY